MRRRFAALMAACGLVPQWAVADPIQPTSEISETIIVTANRVASPRSQVGNAVTLIEGAALRQKQAVSVVDALGEVQGVSSSRNGGLGGVTYVRLRGAESDQTMVVIDDVKISDPAAPGGGTNLANLLTGNVARIEVLLGPQSTLYGSQAIGGVIALTTQLAQGPLTRELVGEVGDAQFLSLRALASKGGPKIGWAMTANHVQSGGISALAPELGGKERDSYRNLSLSWRLAVTLNDLASLDLRLNAIHANVGIDGFPPPDYAFADTPERTKTDEWSAYAGLRLASTDGRLSGRIGASRARVERVSSDPSSNPTTTFDALGQTDRLDGLVRYDLNAKIQIIGGFEHEAARYEIASPSSFDPDPVPQKADTQANALFVQGQLRPLPTLTATLGARHTQHDRFGDAVNLRTTFAWAPGDGNTIVRASYGDGFKAPSLFQLFSDYGNLDLKPETARALDVGIEQKLFGDRLVLTANAFARQTKDQIDFVSCFGVTLPQCANRPFGTYGNVARTRAWGTELSFQLKPWAGLSFSGGFSDLEATNRTRGDNFGKALARRPRQITNLTIGYDWARGHNLALALYDVSASFDDGANLNRVKPYQTLALRGQYALTPTRSVFARIENAGDSIYQSTLGYGAPRRQAFIGLRHTF